MITLDTSAILALLEPKQRQHRETVAALESDPGPYFIPMGIVAEVTYMIDLRLDQRAVEVFLHDLAVGAYALWCGENDLPRILELVHRYANLPLGFPDAAVIACAEQLGRRVLTLDRRDFDIVARETTLTLLPDWPAR